MKTKSSIKQHIRKGINKIIQQSDQITFSYSLLCMILFEHLDLHLKQDC